MLSSLQVQNYALIRQLEIEFDQGLTIITGETGAGKSILLGALGLLMGNRADASILKDQDKKCFVEGRFMIGSYGLEWFFKENDLDYENPVILRREISPGGKSRAFINDTPVNLSLVRELGFFLVDIHSQHQNLNLGDHHFQLKVVDTVADNKTLLTAYRDQFKLYTELGIRLAKLKERARQTESDLDYFSFQFNQLDEAKLSVDEQEFLEQELQTLIHAEEIRSNLLQIHSLADGEEGSIRDQLRKIIQAFASIRNYYPDAIKLGERAESVWIELKDIAGEAETAGSRVELDPSRLQFVSERLDMLYGLMQKHGVNDLAGLVSIRDGLDIKIAEISSFDEQIESLEKDWNDSLASLERLSLDLSSRRGNAIPLIEKEVNSMLRELGIPNATFRIQMQALSDFCISGKDEMEFLFSANKQVPPQEISRVASGGELSRLMLSIKSLLSESLELPTIIFDEVDSGVSGEIADKVGVIMKRMSKGKQVLNITHLPQVAGKGEHHFLVFKFEEAGADRTGMRLLNNDERVLEIARMLSGEALTEAAISNARELMN